MAEFVLEATVVGVPDDVWGEKAMAIVKLVPGSDKNEQDIIDFLKAEGVDKGKITKWMLPKLVAITNMIPRTSVGKFDKIQIRKNLDKFLQIAKQMRSDKQITQVNK
jgi:acyl-CoA synthetase (AMP-forming)/AMP-acid ligase II